MAILLTRPEEDCAATIKALAAHGVTGLAQPLFSLVPCPATLPVKDYQAVIATSRHSITLFCSLALQRDIPVFCVGAHTAAVAREQGFADVRSADGNAKDLAQLLLQTCSPDNGPLLRLKGDYPDPLSDTLHQAGFEVDGLTLYSMQPQTGFSAATLQALKNATLTGVCFYSPNAAAQFRQIIEKNGLTDACQNLKAFCISENAAKALDPFGFKAILIASHPTHQAMIDLMTHSPS